MINPFALYKKEVENQERIANALENIGRALCKSADLNFIKSNHPEAIENTEVKITSSSLEQIADEEIEESRSKISVKLGRSTSFWKEDDLTANELDML